MFSYCVCGHLIPFPLNSACLRGRASYLISALPHQSRRWAELNSVQNTSCRGPQDPDLSLTREALRSSTGLSGVTHPQEVCKIHVTVSEMGRETVYNQAHFNIERIRWVYCSIVSTLLFARYNRKKVKRIVEKRIFVCVLDRLSCLALQAQDEKLSCASW